MSNLLLALPFECSIESLGAAYWDVVEAAQSPRTQLRFRNDAVLHQLGMESQQISNHTSFRSLGAIPMSFATRSRTMDLEADALEAEELEEEAKQDDKVDISKTSENKSGWCCFRTTSNSLIEIVVFVCLVLALTVLSVLL